MPGFERPPADMETKDAALATPTHLWAAPPRRRELHTAVIGPTGVERGGDVIMRGAFTKALARRTPKVVIGGDWQRLAGKVNHAVELPPGDPRLPTHTADGAPWPSAGGGLLCTVELMPSTTRDSALAVKAVRANGARQRWGFGFKVLKAQVRGGIRRIADLEIYSLSPHLLGEAEGKAATASGLEFKVADAAPTSVRMATDGRWVLKCSLCGLPSGLADRPLPRDARFVCATCADAAGRLVDPLGEPDIDDATVPDPGLLTVADQAMAAEIELDANADGTLVRARHGERAWRP